VGGGCLQPSISGAASRARRRRLPHHRPGSERRWSTESASAPSFGRFVRHARTGEPRAQRGARPTLGRWRRPARCLALRVCVRTTPLPAPASSASGRKRSVIKRDRVAPECGRVRPSSRGTHPRARSLLRPGDQALRARPICFGGSTSCAPRAGVMCRCRGSWGCSENNVLDAAQVMGRDVLRVVRAREASVWVELPAARNVRDRAGTTRIGRRKGAIL
jgi:hypothetical protein